MKNIVTFDHTKLSSIKACGFKAREELNFLVITYGEAIQEAVEEGKDIESVPLDDQTKVALILMAMLTETLDVALTRAILDEALNVPQSSSTTSKLVEKLFHTCKKPSTYTTLLAAIVSKLA